jgi:hypothetical protein
MPSGSVQSARLHVIAGPSAKNWPGNTRVTGNNAEHSSLRSITKAGARAHMGSTMCTTRPNGNTWPRRASGLTGNGATFGTVHPLLLNKETTCVFTRAIACSFPVAIVPTLLFFLLLLPPCRLAKNGQSFLGSQGRRKLQCTKCHHSDTNKYGDTAAAIAGPDWCHH